VASASNWTAGAIAARAEEGHPQTVALLSGPLVLFAMTGGATAVTSQQLLAAIRIGPQKWRVATGTGSIDLLPFTAIADEPYTTYFKVA